MDFMRICSSGKMQRIQEIIRLQKRKRGLQKGFRNHLYSFRISQEISQEKLARTIGVSRQTISSIENGDTEPSVFLALRIAQYFRTPVENLFQIVPEKK